MFIHQDAVQAGETGCTRYELDHGLVCHMAHTRDIPGAAMSAQAQQLSHPLLRAPQPDMGVAHLHILEQVVV